MHALKRELIDQSNLPKLKELHKRIEQKETELRQSNERYRMLVEMLPEIVIVHDEQEIKFINEYGANLFGFEKTELLGTDIRNIIHPEDLGHAKLLLSGIERGYCNQEDFVELRFKRHDGSTMLGEVGSSIIPWYNEDHIQTVIRDITHRKKIETSLIKYYYNSGVVNTLPISGKNRYELADGWTISLVYRDESKDVYHTKATKNTILPKHNHIQRETITVVEGDITVFLGGDDQESMHLTKGDTYKIASTVDHEVIANEDSLLEIEYTPPLSAPNI